MTDGRTDGGDCNIPYAFLKKRGDNKAMLKSRMFQEPLLTLTVFKDRFIDEKSFIP